jgi:beta-lactamase regulating signal transducer with metallopeptidase domain
MTHMVFTTVLLALAWFTVLNLATSLMAWLVGAVIHRRAPRLYPAVLLGVRLFPAGASLLVAIVLFIPAHWITEARDVSESFGYVLYFMAAAGTMLLARCAARAVALNRADRRLRERERASPLVPQVREAEGVPGLALAGLLRPRILMGRQVVTSLTAAELDVAIAHEVAHRRAIDNLKRWALHCAPDFFGSSAIAKSTERAWHAAAESVADARAVRGDAQRALDLASALIKVARLTAAPPAFGCTPVWSPFNDPALLERRVHQLTSDVPVAAPSRPIRTAGAAALLLVLTALLVPVLSGAIHRVTEAAVAFLP